jgi:hypothetical protein
MVFHNCWKMCLARSAWFMNGGDPAHLSWTVKNVLRKTCHDEWLFRAGLVACSPTTGQLKSFAETLKNVIVFSTNRTGRNTAQNHFYACQNIRHHPWTCEKVWQSMIRCVPVHWFKWRTFGALVNWAWYTKEYKSNWIVNEFFRCIKSLVSKILQLMNYCRL